MLGISSQRDVKTIKVNVLQQTNQVLPANEMNIFNNNNNFIYSRIKNIYNNKLEKLREIIN